MNVVLTKNNISTVSTYRGNLFYGKDVFDILFIPHFNKKFADCKLTLFIKTYIYYIESSVQDVFKIKKI